MNDTKQLWNTALSEIELSVSKANFTTWFKNTNIVKEEEGIVFISVPNSFVKEWLYNKYHKFILKSLREVKENVRGVEYIITPKGEELVGERVTTILPHTQNTIELPLKDLYINKDDNLNSRYSFETFVVGPFNELANAAARAIIKNPGVVYNPLFIHGPTGLGKTHLIQAVGNEIKKQHASKKVFYTTSEKFFLDYINSVQVNKISIFKEKYRKYDVFIMDDIQFFGGKQGTQDELFHLFNSLYDNNKQIIFSSDKHCNYIPDIEDRLKSRFSQGMIVDISEPDLESRAAILRSKIKSLGFSLPDETISFVASSLKGNVRELEGILNAIICQAQVKNKDLTLNEIRTIVKNNKKDRKTISTEDVVEIVTDFYNLEKDFIYQKTRRREVVKPRQIIMFLLREDFGVSYPTIGQKLGGRDHTTVIHSCEKVRKDLELNSSLSQELEQIRSMF
ncbi:MAG: chromosomal replication initiator protein DnaA [Candidatus Paceibacterota bacterium]